MTAAWIWCHRYVRRRPDEEFDLKCIRGTVKGGGSSVMAWGAMRRDVTGPVHCIEGIMDKNVHVDILKSVTQPYARNSIGQEYIFQHDNDPKRTSALVKTLLSSANVEVLEWSAQSPDWNPIENLWVDVNEAIQRRKPKNIKELHETIENAWYDIPTERCQKLVNSMPRRCASVIKSGGYEFPTSVGRPFDDKPFPCFCVILCSCGYDSRGIAKVGFFDVKSCCGAILRYI
ncbi:hypothetical protein Aduo_018704 [Ancylostoma duodenale]